MEEAEWAVEACKATGKPTAVSMCIGPQGDMHGIPTGECAVRLAHAGIKVIVLVPHCSFDCGSELKTSRIILLMFLVKKDTLTCVIKSAVLF